LAVIDIATALDLNDWLAEARQRGPIRKLKWFNCPIPGFSDFESEGGKTCNPSVDRNGLTENQILKIWEAVAKKRSSTAVQNSPICSDSSSVRSVLHEIE
jgi:hypothetical protein